MNERIHDLRKAMYQFMQSAYTLSEKWEELDAENRAENDAFFALSNGYPFENSFDEKCAEICEWFHTSDDLLVQIEKGEQK